MDDEKAIQLTKEILWDNVLLSETIGQMELIIPEENMSPEQLENAEQLIRDLLSLLPEDLRRTLYK